MKRPQPRVLIVDDIIEMAKTLADGLSERGYDAVAAGGGRDAIDRLASETIDAVITDLRMPGVDGMAVLAASRAADPQRPVIVMTAYSALDSAIESIRQGAYHYLTKPFKLEELAIFLQRALAGC
jgi:two-component system response regulator HydG